MKISELLTLEPQFETRNLSILTGCYYNWISEADITDYSVRSKRVLIKIYGYRVFDNERFWRLGSVYFDDIPVMVFQNAGRGGDDWRERYVLNIEAFSDMCLHLRTLSPQKVQPPFEDFTSLDVDIPELTCFYGHALGDDED